MLKTLRPFLLTTLLALSLSGCFTAPAQTTPVQVKEVPGPTRVVDNSCIWFKPETPTDHDVAVMSRTLVDQITENTKAGIQHCHWKYGN